MKTPIKFEIGMETNLGKITDIDSKGFIYFIRRDGSKGWCGPQATNIIQIREK